MKCLRCAEFNMAESELSRALRESPIIVRGSGFQGLASASYHQQFWCQKGSKGLRMVSSGAIQCKGLVTVVIGHVAIAAQAIGPS